MEAKERPKEPQESKGRCEKRREKEKEKVKDDALRHCAPEKKKEEEERYLFCPGCLMMTEKEKRILVGVVEPLFFFVFFQFRSLKTCDHRIKQQERKKRKEKERQTVEGKDLIAEGVEFGTERVDLGMGGLFLALDVSLEMIDLATKGGDGGDEDFDLFDKLAHRGMKTGRQSSTKRRHSGIRGGWRGRKRRR